MADDGPDSSNVSVIPEASIYSAGSDITLFCSSESNPAAQFQWALNGTLLSSEGPELQLNDVQDHESGAYICWANNSKTQRYKPSSPQSITVIEKISNVTAEANQNELVEFNNSVILTCSASGTSPLFQWLNGSDKVTGSNRVELNKGNLNILNVTRYDNGPFKCNVSNTISYQMSSDVNLTIHYGPDSSNVSVTPEASIYSAGSDITLSCSSESNPAAQFQWALNGTLLSSEGPELHLNNVQDHESGAYICWANNSKTQRYKPSSPQSITVIEKISNVTAEADQNELMEFNNSVTLTCSASGTSPLFQWFNRSALVTGSDRVLLDKRKITILKVARHDKGPFQYGPDSAVVSVTPEASIYSSGSDITLSCSSESNPAAQVQWALNGALLSREGPELRLDNVQTKRISRVTAEADQNELMEFNDSVTLTCSASGANPSFRWFNRSTAITGSDGVLLKNRKFTIFNVTRYDNGPFKCEVSNSANGPDSAVVSVTPEASIYSVGSDITLSCSSESNPAAQVQWALNGTLLGREGPELRLDNVQTSQSGAYSCWAYNSKTQRNMTSSATNITVIVPKKVKMVRVEIQARVNMEDPVVQEAILKEIHQRLWKTGMPEGTTLRWTTHPNGKIFQEKKNEKAGGEKKN
ncbi:carcinoembryonic antigen-related cell adhesion molecule 5-like [Sardina pilchardus]|uniref:carcinoembryonic antigen-related cell adhesion molecule 5-like n=1 Tax=Sardina pilchardus TaxID=27697 RepID=UPI002E142C33